MDAKFYKKISKKTQKAVDKPGKKAYHKGVVKDTKVLKKEVQSLNAALLEYEMKRAGVSTTEMCEKLHISRSAFFRKCNGQSQFKLKEIQQIVEILKLESPAPIFFSD